ncbi:MAG TPA: DUF4349 domain-containing protein, partial [bacterium]|nr:DUF4349 domain-containing protein [bacterium]
GRHGVDGQATDETREIASWYDADKVAIPAAGGEGVIGKPVSPAPTLSNRQEVVADAVETSEEYVIAPLPGDGGIVPDASNQKIIKNATYTLEAETPAVRAQVLIDLAVSHYSGFAQDSQISKTERKDKDGETYTVETAHLVLRIPVEKYDEFRNEIMNGEGLKILSEHLTGDDVTKQYVDLEARIRNLKAEEEQLQVLLQRATTVDEILQVRSYLTSTREQIEVATAELKNLDSSVSYSTFNLTISQPNQEEEPKPEEEEKWSLRTVLKQAWDNLVVDYQGLIEDAVNIIVSSFILLPFVIGLVIVLLVLRKLFRRGSHNS